MILLFVMASGFSITTSVNSHASTVNFFLLCASITGYLAAKYLFDLRNPDFILPVMIALVCGAVFVSVNGIYQYYYGLDEMREMINIDQIRKMALLYKDVDPQNYALYQRLVSNRIFSTFVYPNSLAGFLCMLIPFVCEMIRQYKKSFFRIYGWICLISCIVLSLWFFLQSLFFFIPIAIGCILLFPLTMLATLFLTASKGGILTCLVVMGFYSVILCKEYFKFRVRTVFIIVLSLLAVLILFERTMLPGKLKSLEARFDYWKASVEMIKEKPLFGYGLGTFGIVYPKYRLQGAEETQFAHNSFLQIWIETGFIGFISFISVWLLGIGVFLKKILRNGLSFPRTAAGLALIGFSLHSLVDFDFSIPALSFLAFYFLGIVDARTAEKPFELALHKNKLIILLICVLFIAINHKNISNYLDAQAYYDAARYVYKQEHDTTQALELLNTAIEKNPSNGKLYFLAGTICFHEDMIDKSIRFFEEAVKYDHHRASYHYQLGLAYQKSSQKNYREKAVIEFSKAIEYNPQKQEYLKTYHEVLSVR